MGICSQPDKPKSDPVPRFIDISAGDASFVSANSWLTAANANYDKNFLKGEVNIAGTNLRVFSYAQLDAATNNLGRDMMVARGVFSFVHEGWQKKKIPLIGAEVNILGKLSHPNLVKLLGYCHEKEVPLVYDLCTYVSSGAEGSIQPLPWDIRLKVAVGIAQGLAYLHSPEVLVIHRDLRSSNILLDKFYNAKISDFGLASVLSPDDSRVETRDGHSDVYSFGVVLVEMLTGSRAIDTKRPNGKDVVVNWVIPFLSNKRKLKKKTMDTRLEGKYPIKEASLIAQFAIRCLQLEPKFRPSMKEIAETSEQIVAHQLKAT
ncbi:hypothetical protein POTOM_056541 [Populus tomentosa]|uniref:non-specific serine/threonine protein kinase n=1 Tax=Populus tomentosa TaxID=118781 RepID=A0A8X7Y1A1_POPTO|nr:hypothetical protein POTOM_056541 [Populus tomentosa]